jgi:hypothetical protein
MIMTIKQQDPHRIHTNYKNYQTKFNITLKFITKNATDIL